MRLKPGRTNIALVCLIILTAPLPALEAASGDNELKLATVLEALSLTGTPYLYGGNGLRGLDCSGLVYMIYASRTPGLPRRADDQYRFGAPVATGSEEPGDLVFFNTEGWGASHVGIYLGKDRFVHAASGKGRSGIIISSLLTPYYRIRYLGARRLAAQ